MSWEIIGVVVIAFGVVAGVITNLRTIMNTFGEGIALILSSRYKRKQSWPFEIEILSIKIDQNNPISPVWVKFRLKPHKEAIVDSCELQYIDDPSANARPITPMNAETNPEWIVGKSNRLQRDVEMYFNSKRLNGEVRIVCASEGMVCMSRPWRLNNDPS